MNPRHDLLYSNLLSQVRYNRSRLIVGGSESLLDMVMAQTGASQLGSFALQQRAAFLFSFASTPQHPDTCV